MPDRRASKHSPTSHAAALQVRIVLLEVRNGSEARQGACRRLSELFNLSAETAMQWLGHGKGQRTHVVSMFVEDGPRLSTEAHRPCWEGDGLSPEGATPLVTWW